MNKNELYHFGVPGMKWGIRKDRRSGKKRESRYKRGARYNAEYSRVKSEEHAHLKEINKDKFDKYYNEASFLAKKYGLDEDDGGGGDTERFTQKQLDDAGRRYMELYDKAEYLDNQLAKQSTKKAEAYIRDTYGETALGDIQHYNNMKNLAIASAFVAVYAGMVVTPAVINSRKNR